MFAFLNWHGMEWRVPYCFFLYMVINLLMASAGTARLAGISTKRIATSITLFNTYVLISRLANLFMMPVIGRLADIARVNGDVHALATQYRLILGASTLGCLFAFFLIPTFIVIFERGILAFERTNSLPRVFLGLLNPGRGLVLFVLFLVSVIASFTVPVLFHVKRFAFSSPGFAYAAEGSVILLLAYPSLAMLYWIFRPAVFRKSSLLGITWRSLKGVPSDFLILNVLVQAFWSVGFLSAYYAGAVEGKYALTAVALSGIVTGVSTVLFTIFVDPKAALITDQVAHGLKPIEQIRAVVVFLTVGSIAGTVLAQFLFWPASWLIIHVAAHI